MRIVTAELRKLLTWHFFAVLLIAVIANLFLFHHNLLSDYSFYSHQAYVTAQRDVMALPDGQRLTYLQEKIGLLDACTRWENEGDPMITDETRSYWELYTGGGYLQYTDDLFAERFLFRDLLKEMQQITNHTQHLETIIREAETKTTVSIFAEPGSFSYRSQLAAVDRFRELLSIKPTYAMSAGVLHFQASPATDMIALVVILFFCTQMAIGEQKSGMLPILRATRKGRLPLVGAKVLATVFLSWMIVCILWGMNLGYCGVSFGLGDLSRPVQSLPGFTTCTLKVSVKEYLLLFLFLKWMLYSLVGIWCLAVGIFLQKAMPTWLTIGGLLGAGYILAQVISPISGWNILKFVNISNLIFSVQWLSEYRNLNFFGYPVEVFAASWVLMGLLGATGTGLLCWLFCRGKVLSRSFLVRTPQWLPFQGKSTALLGHELWKLLVECGGAVVLVLLLLINLQEPRSRSYDTNALHYKNYMERLAGPLTEEKQAFLESEVLRFEAIHEQIIGVQKAYAAGEISETERNALLPSLERALMAEQVLISRVWPQLERIAQLSREGKAAQFVYEPGYLYLFGLDPQHSKAGSDGLVIAGVILCFANFFPLEISSGMQPILNISKRGRAATIRCKLLVCVGFTVLIFLIAQIPDYWYVFKNYGFPGWYAPFCSLEVFSRCSDAVSILGGILLFEVLRLVAVVSVAVAVLLLGRWTKNQLITLSVSTGIFLMPVLLKLLSIPN